MNKSKALVISVIAAMAYWLLESIVHEVIYPDRTFVTDLFRLDIHELWMRISAGVLIFVTIYSSITLTAARREIKALKGIIPICAWCKKQIRTGENDWQDVDRYIEEHSEAVFSHGICPDCSEKFAGEKVVPA